MRRVSHLTGAVLVGAFGLTGPASAQPPPEMALTPSLSQSC
jgi:hypothetical protein